MLRGPDKVQPYKDAFKQSTAECQKKQSQQGPQANLSEIPLKDLKRQENQR